MSEVVRGLESYFRTDNRDYVHFVDGGITDNLGLRAIYEVMEIAGGPAAILQKRVRSAPAAHDAHFGQCLDRS